MNNQGQSIKSSTVRAPLTVQCTCTQKSSIKGEDIIVKLGMY